MRSGELMDDPIEYQVTAVSRRGAASLEALGARIEFDGTAHRPIDVPGPAELFAGAFAACALKNVERFSRTLPFAYRSARIEVTAIRAVDPPRIAGIRYDLAIDTDEPAARIDLLRRNVEKFGTIYNTVAAACDVNGTIHRAVEEITP